MSMQAAPVGPTEPRRTALPIPSVPAQVVMDRDFIARNQIVERYIGGRLPLKGAQDFERYCAEHPQLLDDIGLTERINCALRMLEAGGRGSPWEVRAKRWWQKLPVLLGAAGLALILAIVTLVLLGNLSARDHSIAALRQQLAVQALDPAQSTRAITLIPNRAAPSPRSMVTIGGKVAEMADLKFDMSWSKYNTFRVIIDRGDQGRVAVLHNVERDSNGILFLGINTSALGPGNYAFTIEGLTLRGETDPQAWATITIAH
jgi:hypothetical protein